MLNTLSGNILKVYKMVFFPRVTSQARHQLFKWQLPKCAISLAATVHADLVRPSEAPQTAIGPSAAGCNWTKGARRGGNYPILKLPLGNIPLWRYLKNPKCKEGERMTIILLLFSMYSVFWILAKEVQKCILYSEYCIKRCKNVFCILNTV